MLTDRVRCLDAAFAHQWVPLVVEEVSAGHVQNLGQVSLAEVRPPMQLFVLGCYNSYLFFLFCPFYFASFGLFFALFCKFSHPLNRPVPIILLFIDSVGPQQDIRRRVNLAPRH